MFLHVLNHSVNISEISCMSELVQFVMSDCLNTHLFSDISQVGIRCCDCCDTGTRETDLGSRRELVNHIRVSFFLTLH